MPNIPALNQIERDLRMNPKFAVLDYNDQTYVRLTKYGQALKQDERFMQLSAQDKKFVLEKIALQTPVFADKQVEGYVNQVFQKYQANPEAKSTWTEKSAADQMMDVTQRYRMDCHSVIAGTLDKRIIYPLFKKLGALPEGTQAIASSEAAKAVDFFDAVLAQDKRYAKISQVLSTVVPIVAELGETVALFAATGVGGISGTVGKAASAAAKTRTVAAIGKAAGYVAEEVAEGFLIWGQHFALDLLNKGIEKNSSVAEVAWNNRKYFYEGMLLGVGINAAMGTVFPFLKQMKQSFIPGKARGQIKPWLNFGDLTEMEMTKIIDDAVGMKPMDPQLLKRLPVETQEVLTEATQRMNFLKHVKNYTDKNELFKTFAFSQGYMARQVDDLAWKVRPVLGKEWTSFSSMDLAQEFVAKELSKVTDFSEEAAAQLGIASKTARIQKVLKGNLKEGAEKDINVLTRLIAPHGGKFNTEKVKAFSRAFMKANGVKDSVYRTAKVYEQGNNIVLELNKKPIAKVLKDATIDEEKQVRGLIDGIMDATQGNRSGKSSLAQHLKDQYKTSITEQQIYSPAWIKYAAETQLGGVLTQTKAGKYILTFADGTKQNVDNLQEFGNSLIRKNLDRESFADYLAHDRGLQVKTSPDGGLHVYRGKREIATGENVEEVLTRNPELTPKIPDQMGPQLTFENNQVKVLGYVKGTAIGRYDQILKHLDQFSSRYGKRSLVTLVSKKGGSMRLYKGSAHLEVVIPEINHRKVFDNIKEAKAWLDDGWKSWSEVTKAAQAKGIRVVGYQGKYLLKGAGRDMQVVENIDDVYKTLSKTPTPEWMPELSGLSEDLTLNLPKPQDGAFNTRDLLTPDNIDDTSPILWKGLRKVFGDQKWIRKGENWHLSAQSLYRPPEAYLAELVRRGVGDEGLLKSFNDIETSLAALRGEDWKLETVLNSIWRRGNKWISRDKRIAIGKYMETPEIRKSYKAMELGLTSDDLETARLARQLYGETSEKGLAGRFGIDPEIFENEYLSRIRRFYIDNPGKQYYAGETKKFLKDAFGGQPPRGLDAFFKHLRVNEIAQWAMEEDPLRIMQKYIRAGNREMILGPLWKNVDDYLKMNYKDLDPTMVANFELYRSRIMGIPQGAVENLIHHTHARIWKQIGLNDKAISNDIIKLGMNYTYLSAMAYRPWLPVRNSFQIGTMLAPRVGNEYVVRAVKDLAGDKTGEIYNRLRGTGVVFQQIPVPGGEQITAEGVLGKLTKRGLQWYKNSDEFTRAVAYRAAELRFMDAADRFTKGIFGSGAEAGEKFAAYAGLDFEQPLIKNQIRELVSKGHWGPAKDLFASRMVENTMFIYRPEGRPLAFRGTIGKLFGMMGTYPVYYAENVRKALQHASTGAKLAFAGRFVANSMLFYGAFKALGVNATNFLPWVPMSFSGGPMYQTMNTALQSMDFRSYKGRQARAEMFGITQKNGKLQWQPHKSEFAKWLPTFAVNGVFKGIGMANEGDFYGAFLTMTGFPYKAELLQNMSV